MKFCCSHNETSVSFSMVSSDVKFIITKSYQIKTASYVVIVLYILHK